jgi:hypothetical protein
MANYVYMSVNAQGDHDAMTALRTALNTKPRLVDDKDWDPDKDQFSYHAFITPDQDVTDTEYHSTNGWKDGVQVGNTPGNWYNWNLANWNTKWDANEVAITWATNDEGELWGMSVSFNSAWDAPYPVFKAMTEQHPKIDWTFDWEEEQGWGGRAQGVGGDYEVLREWDIPNSHKDWADLEQDDRCVCSWEDDKTEWYEDCPGWLPKTTTTYTIQVVHTYEVEARHEAGAIDAIEAYESSYDMEDGSKVLSVEYKTAVNVIKEVSNEPDGSAE